ncbi:MAG: NADH-quinone oxidoreductase subunit G [Alphaproteobacteria bacterium]|jgi:NADH-quinone oxidoreductase subunit G|nr:NADH-quinone oxidoreductase subunit G [Alphaproteobacteria bacterium]MBT5828328.1 NADH-quinone oxidoreductase subunit G [Alphaproteobacteria bacterium]
MSTVKIKIDSKEYEVPAGITLIQACDLVGVEIPRFCYHDRLSVAGNCRMCLVELSVGPRKPQASCATQVMEGLEVKTDSDMVKNARNGAMEFLLANHPLDCPICDQGGECDLQDQAMFYGAGESRFEEDKRAVSSKDLGPLIKTHMTRCIHCTRCVRFVTEVAGVPELGAVNRGESTEITTYVEKSLSSELSGNIIDLCPVGALTSKPYAFKARPWELTKTDSIDVHDAVGSNIRVDSRAGEVVRILPRLNESINEEWISDKTRFSYDGLALQRLDRPYIKKGGKFVEASYVEALNLITDKVLEVKETTGQIGALAGDLADVESIYILKELMQNLGSNNYDARPKNSVMNNSNRSEYLFNTTIESIEEADLCLLIGVNPRIEAAILNSRIRKQHVNNKDFIIANIGVEHDLTYPYEQLGDSPAIIAELISGKNNFAQKLKVAKKPMIIVGESAYIRDDAEALIGEINNLVEKFSINKEGWQGFNVLNNAAARVGALDVGFTPVENGMDTKSMFEAVKNKKLNLMFLLGYDHADVKELKNSFNVYIGTHGDAGVSVADVILPAACYTEKNALYVNLEGRVQQAIQAIRPIGEAKIDWEIINDLKKMLKFESYKDLRNLRDNIYGKFPHLAKHDEITILEAEKLPLKSSNKKIADTPFENYLDNFYMTNAITRNSVTLTKCVKEILEKKNV